MMSECRICGTALHPGARNENGPVEIGFGEPADRLDFATDFLDSPNAEVHTFDRCRWAQALHKLGTAEKRAEALLQALKAARDASRDRQAFVAQGPRAWIRVEMLLDEALAGDDAAQKGGGK
jgi:hypothetical protein